MRQSFSTKKCRCVHVWPGSNPELLVSLYRSLSTRLLDPAHDAIDQTYPHGRGAVSCGAGGGELKIQLVDAETAGPNSVEFLQLVLSP
jgi:hypothetical protein